MNSVATESVIKSQRDAAMCAPVINYALDYVLKSKVAIMFYL